MYFLSGRLPNVCNDNDFFSATNKWSRLELEGPAPSCRLDFAMCTISLRAPSLGPDSTGDMNTARSQAKEVLEQEMRMGSAGSVRSVGSGGSAGSQRSLASASSLPRDDKVPSDPSSPGILIDMYLCQSNTSTMFVARIFPKSSLLSEAFYE